MSIFHMEGHADERAGSLPYGAQRRLEILRARASNPCLLRLDEPATDLAVILAIASSYKDLPVGSDLAAVGEVGLSGEIRSVSHLNQRLSEIARLGFRRCIIPAHVRDDVQKQNGLQTIPVKNIREALKAVFGA